MSGYVEIAVVSRRYLTADVHMTPEEGEAVLDALAERAIVRIEYALSDEHRIALRLMGRGSVGPAAS